MEPGILLRLIEGATVRSLVNRPNPTKDELRRSLQDEGLLDSSSSPSVEKKVVQLSKEDKTKVAKTLLEAGLSFDEVAAVLDSIQSID